MSPIIKGGRDVSDVDKLDLILYSSVASRCHNVGSDGAPTWAASRLPLGGPSRDTNSESRF